MGVSTQYMGNQIDSNIVSTTTVTTEIMADGYQPINYNRQTSNEKLFSQLFTFNSPNEKDDFYQIEYPLSQENHIDQESIDGDEIVVLEPVLQTSNQNTIDESDLDFQLQFSPSSSVSSNLEVVRTKMPKRATRDPLPEEHRPGKRPSIPDSALTETELIRKNRRRERNREAAARQRDKRNQKVNQFKDKITKAEDERDMWKNKYEELKAKYEKERFQWKVNQNPIINQTRTVQHKPKQTPLKIVSLKNSQIPNSVSDQNRKRTLTMSPSLDLIADLTFDFDPKKAKMFSAALQNSFMNCL